MPHLTRNDAKGLWAVFWRTLIVFPFVWLLGLALLVLILALLAGPPCYAGFTFVEGNWFSGILILIGWVVLLRFILPLLRWMLEGVEYGGI